jgi:hypothetical protein
MTDRPPIALNRYGALYQRVMRPRCTVLAGRSCRRPAARELLFHPPRPKRNACILCLKRWCRLHGYRFHPQLNQLTPLP